MYACYGTREQPAESMSSSLSVLTTATRVMDGDFTVDAEKTSNVLKAAKQTSDEALIAWLETEYPPGKDATPGLEGVPEPPGACCVVL